MAKKVEDEVVDDIKLLYRYIRSSETLTAIVIVAIIIAIWWAFFTMIYTWL